MTTPEDAIIIPPNAVAEYSLKEAALQELQKVEAGLAGLKTDYAGKVYEVTNILGMAQAKQARMVIREIRYRIPKIIDEKKRLIKAAIKEMEESGAKITEALFELETPIHNQIDAEETRKKEEKAKKNEEARQRLQRISEAIEKIKLIPIRCAAMTSEQLIEQIAFIEAMPIGDDFFGEFRPSAQDAKTAAYQSLVALNNVALELEERQAEQKRQEEEERQENERKAQEERDRLAEQQKELDRQKEEFEEQKRQAEENNRLQREKFEAEQAEANRKKEEKDRQEQTEREEREAQERTTREAEEKRCDEIAERLNAIRNMGMIDVPCSLAMIQARIDEVNAVPVTPELFDEFTNKAVDVKEEVLAHLSFKYGDLKQYIEREEQQQRDRDELKRQQDQMAETLRLAEEEQEKERQRLQDEKEKAELAGKLMKEQIERQEAERIEELRKNHKFCGCPFCQGIKGEEP